ncbi:MAG: uracil-DNA glycosylase family protein [Geminicoccaceae bacterium]
MADLIEQAGGAGSDQDARALAVSCRSVAELREALVSFEGCALKKTAMNLCFGDGNPDANVMFIGEAPGSEEDRQGVPFVGPSGRLLDRMLDAAGMPRSSIFITNVVFWRPPGNRSPTADELAVCQPFIDRLITLVAPRILVAVGGIAARAVLGVNEGVTRLRGRRFVHRGEDQLERPATVMFHPAYLLRQPLHKGLAWRDLLQIRSWLDDG